MVSHGNGVSARTTTTTTSTATSTQLQGTMTYNALRSKLSAQQVIGTTSTAIQDQATRPLTAIRTIQTVQTAK